MKRIFISLILLAFLLGGCTSEKNNNTSFDYPNDATYVKSVWITYYELQELMDSSEKVFRKNINSAFSSLSKMGFNTVTVQVRPCADAFYKSKYFPSSVYCFGKQGSELPFDPLEIMCEIADKNELKIEAWVNPYRVSQDSDVNKLSDDNIAKKWYKSDKKKNNVLVVNDKLYFNPASDEVTELIVNGVKELVKNYNINAVHFDDYFYPDMSKNIDKKEYNEYKKEGGKLQLYDWRRENVNKMLEKVYSSIKKINPETKFGISPAANINNDYHDLYADVNKWCTVDGYLDYICPQVYYGFKNETMPFMQTTKKWAKMSQKPLYIGLPLYKSGTKDKYASEDNKNAINEFCDNDNTISRQITYISKIKEISGFYIFSYGSLKDKKCKKEVENLMNVLK